MKKAVLFLPQVPSAGAFAQNNTVVRWRNIVGVITAPGVDNPVGQIHRGAWPWSVRSGNAKVNLTTGEGSFDVDGLVSNGGNSSGTPGGVSSVVGTLVLQSGQCGWARNGNRHAGHSASFHRCHRSHFQDRCAYLLQHSGVSDPCCRRAPSDRYRYRADH